jgi:hypothetical protein
MQDPIVEKLFATTDGYQWATEWCFIAKTLPLESLIDLNWMTGWFANAIEVAKDHERKHMLGHDQKGPSQFEQILQKGAANRTDVDKAMVAAIMLLSTQAPYMFTMSPMQVFDHFVQEHDRIYG